MKRRIAMAALILFGVTQIPLQSQSLEDMAFFNQPIRDILEVLGRAGGITLSFDETVEGQTSFRSPGMEVREAVELFLEQNRLYGSWKGDVLHVSRIRVTENGDGTLNVDAEDAGIQEIVLALSRRTARTVIFDALPRESLTLHVRGRTLEALLSIIVMKFPDYVLDIEGELHYIRYERERAEGGGMRLGADAVSREGELYGLQVEQGRFSDILDELFRLAETEYSYLGRNDGVLSRLNFRPRPFGETLRLLLEQANSDFTVVGDVHYIFDIQRSEVLRRHNSVVHRGMRYVNAKEVPGLMPAGMAEQGMITVDEKRNALILYGSLEALGPVQGFLDSLDRPREGRSWVRLDLNYLEPGGLPGILPGELDSVPLKAVPGARSILVFVSPEQKRRFREWLDVADRPMEGYPVTLRFITSEELIAGLPPPFDEKDIKATKNPNLIFFQGSREKLNYFKESLKSMDRPIPQIRYDLLVIQYQDNSSWDWSPMASIRPGSGEGLSLTGNLSPLLSLTFDVSSLFGHEFALGLSTEISESRAKVIADSTLNGLSGEKLSFRNTNTFRYKDIQYDSAGKIILSAEKQLTSGLFITITGTVSGDSMITMLVDTTISKRGSSDSKDRNVLPPTSEKIINTRIRTEAGRPVIIGGLTQQEETTVIKKVPFFGSIPLLGYLFRKENRITENTEFVVYIVPHIEYDRDFYSDEGGLFEYVYEKYIER